MNIVAIMAGGMDGPVESGWIGRVAQERGATLKWFYRRLGDTLPTDISDYDALIVFGGEVSVHDLALKPYFDQLATLIHQFHQQEKPILGSCLGSQAIAYAFNANVKPQGFLEYGFVPLVMSNEGENDPLLFSMPKQLTLFEMHSDMSELPQEATLLMQGESVLNQAFRIGKNTYAFQFHFEVTPEIVSTWTHRELIDNPQRDQLEVAGLYEKVLSDFKTHGANQVNFAQILMNRWIDLIPHVSVVKREISYDQ